MNTVSDLSVASKNLEAKLCNELSTVIYDGIYSLFQVALAESKPDEIFRTFQKFLKEIKTWNNSILVDEVKRIKTEIPSIDKTLAASFMANVKVLNTLRPKNKQVSVVLPTLDYFIHQVYINCAREVYSNPFLFDHRIDVAVQSENKERVMEIIRTKILSTIQSIIPIDELFNDINYVDTMKRVNESAPAPPPSAPAVDEDEEEGTNEYIDEADEEVDEDLPPEPVAAAQELKDIPKKEVHLTDKPEPAFF